MTEFIRWMDAWPDLYIYVVLWIGAGVENLLPAVPADTFVALGGFLAGAKALDPTWVWIGSWLSNVTGALFVYRMSHLHGPAFFERGLGRYLLSPHQLRRMKAIYERWGTPVIFASRFVPGFRAIVPVFAGATHQRWPKVALPIAVASAIWYGGLVWLGLFAGRNLDLLQALMGRMNRTLGGVALFVGALVVVWWIATRSAPDD